MGSLVLEALTKPDHLPIARAQVAGISRLSLVQPISGFYTLVSPTSDKLGEVQVSENLNLVFCSLIFVFCSCVWIASLATMNSCIMYFLIYLFLNWDINKQTSALRYTVNRLLQYYIIFPGIFFCPHLNFSLTPRFPWIWSPWQKPMTAAAQVPPQTPSPMGYETPPWMSPHTTDPLQVAAGKNQLAAAVETHRGLDKLTPKHPCWSLVLTRIKLVVLTFPEEKTSCISKMSKKTKRRWRIRFLPQTNLSSVEVSSITRLRSLPVFIHQMI